MKSTHVLLPTVAQDGNGCIECTLKESSLIARGLPFHFRPTVEPGAAPVAVVPQSMTVEEGL